MHILAHFKTITHHKLLVMKHCFRAGLYWQGLVHDLSKYMPSEFWVGARYYQGDHSPNDAERKAIGYSSAWMHHKGRNKHHYEYWTDYKIGAPKGTIAPMPVSYTHLDVYKRQGIHRALVLIFHRLLTIFYCGLIRPASSSMIFGTSIFCGQCPVQAPHPIQSVGFPWDSILDASFSAHGPSTL